MGRHTIINPATGRRVYKTGRLGRVVQSGKKKPTKSKPNPKPTKQTKQTKSRTSPKNNKKGVPGTTKRPSPMFKTTVSGTARPSARAMYDAGMRGPVIYDKKYHVMAFKANGSPYYKAIATIAK